ncbi:phage tail spike protein [Bacillus wiedmannii]|uniref:phage tail spike protein n=1 Tax=Bacillus wiedmannii TaxID=1890302 RepID=UPI00211D923C|nr:phage tail spike protein [Bacillus wiedmannii]
MRTPSGILHIVDFKTSQIVSAIQPKDYWDDKRHWEIKNNIDTLEFRVFDNTEHAATLLQQNLVLKEVRDGRIVPYVITEAEKDSKDRSVVAYASGEWIQLAKAGIIKPQKIEGKTLNECMGIALAGTKWKIGKTEHNGSHSMTIDEFTDPLTFLKQIASSFELEIQYRAEVVGSQIVGRYVDMVKKRGRDTRKEVTLGKDLMGIKRIENSQNICTALLGFVKKEGGEFITIAEINNGIPYLVDDGAFQRWNEKGQHKFGFYSPETENQDMTPQRLKTLMKTEIEKRVNTSVSYEVQAQSIGQVFGLAHELINEGDTIRIIDRGFTPKLYLEARAIAGDESFKAPTQDKYVFGDYREIVDSNEELRRMYQKILASLQDKVPQGWFDALKDKVKDQGVDIQDAINKSKQAQQESKTAKDLAEATQNYMEQNLVDIIESVKPPTTNLKANKTLWRDISNGKPGILKLWTGTAWESVVPDTAPLQQSIKDVKKDIETAKTELNQKVLSVEGKAQEIAGQIVDVQKQVNDKVDQTWINNQLKDKADKSGVYTKDEIKDGFIGKQIYETDKNGNVKKFQDINTSISQTNEALKQKAEKSELTKINDGLSQLESKTNEIISTADGTKQTLSNLKTQVDNIQVGGRNLLLETATKSHSVKTGENKQHTYFDLAKDAATLMQGKNLAMSFLFTGKVTAWGTTNKWAGFEVKITFTDNTFHYPSCRVENRLTLGKQYNQERFTASAVVMDKPIKEISVYALARDFTGDVLIEKLKLEIGTIATAWTPAPEDQVSTTDFTKKTVEIETTIKGINTSVSNVQNEQGKLTERVTKSEQTAEGFKQSIESLTKKDSEISNKLNTVESTVDGNTKLITSVEKKIDGIDSDVTNLMVGTKELVTPVYFKGGTVKLSQDKFNGNAVVDVTGAWHGLSYHIVNLVKPNKIKIGDKVTYSVWARLKDAPDGVKAQHSIYDGLGLGPELPNVDNRWKQFSGTFTVEKKHMDATDQLIRVEPWEWSGGDRKYIYQQSSPMISVTTKAYPWRPAPEDIGDGNVLTKVTTEIKEQAGKISEKLTSIETKVDNTKLDGRNSLKNSNFSSYIVNDSISWDKSLNGNLQASGWGSGYNGGVADATKGYHAHLDITTFGYPVVAFINKNNIIGRKNRWMGIAEDVVAEFARNNVADKEITISMDIWSDTKGFRINGGLHHFIEGNTAQNFHSGQYVFNVSEVNRWERYTFTIKLHNKYDVTKVARFYIYGGEGIEGVAYVKNVKLELANIATAWTPAPEDQVTTDEFNKKTTEIEKSVGGVTTSVSTVQKNQGTMQSTLNKVEQTTNSNSQSITSLSQTQGKQGEIIQQNTSDITQLNNQIKSKVSETQMQDYVGGLGSVNMYFNSAFEDRIINTSTGVVASRTPSLTKWNKMGITTGTAVTPTSVRNHDGYNSAQIQATGLTANTWTGINQLIPVSADSGKLVLSVWVFANNTEGMDAGGSIEFKFLNGSSVVGQVDTNIRSKLVGGAWTFVSLTADVPTKNVTHVQAGIFLVKNGLMWVSQPQVQQGANPTTFMENPKDYANYDQLVGEIAKKVATTDFNSKVSTLETSINQQSKSIELKAEKTDVYTKKEANGQFGSKSIVDSHTSSIALMAGEITQRVKNNEVASTINQTAQSVLIQAQKIMLDGYIEAKHLKAQELVGVTIKTAPNSEQRFVKLNRQFLELYDKNISRAELKFFNSQDGTAITPALVMGRSKSGGIEGATALYHRTPIDGNGNDNFRESYSTLGVVESYNSNSNLFLYGSGLEQTWGGKVHLYGKDTVTISASRQGDIVIKTDTVAQNTSIKIQPSLDFEVIAGNNIYLQGNGYHLSTVRTNHTFRNGNGNFYFENKNKTSGNNMLLQDDNNNADLRLAYIRIRGSHVSGYQSALQLIPVGENTPTAGLQAGNISYTSLTNRSSRKIKSNIRDLEINALEKIMSLKVKQYNFKSDVEKLYKMRQEAEGTGKLHTTRDIPLQYGLILEDTDETFHADLGDGINLYTLVTLHLDATQKIKFIQDVHEKELSNLKSKVASQDNEIEYLKSQVASQEDRIARLEGLLLQQLIDKKPEQP